MKKFLVNFKTASGNEILIINADFFKTYNFCGIMSAKFFCIDKRNRDQYNLTTAFSDIISIT